MTVQLKELLPLTLVTEADGSPTLDLVEIIQRQHQAIEELQGALSAIASVSKPIGVSLDEDTEARAAIAAIIDGAGT